MEDKGDVEGGLASIPGKPLSVVRNFNMSTMSKAWNEVIESKYMTINKIVTKNKRPPKGGVMIFLSLSVRLIGLPKMPIENYVRYIIVYKLPWIDHCVIDIACIVCFLFEGNISFPTSCM